MGSDNRFWVVINLFVFTAFISLVFTVGDYWKDHNAKIVELIKAGTPPVEAMCAMQDDFRRHPTCIIIATKSAVKQD